jgi:hypothetical protein
MGKKSGSGINFPDLQHCFIYFGLKVTEIGRDSSRFAYRYRRYCSSNLLKHTIPYFVHANFENNRS